MSRSTDLFVTNSERHIEQNVVDKLINCLMKAFKFLFFQQMEVNMSPNLSSKHFAGNRLLYEQVIYNVLRLVGVARPGSKSLLTLRLSQS
jgi:hypothetical protein